MCNNPEEQEPPPLPDEVEQTVGMLKCGDTRTRWGPSRTDTKQWTSIHPCTFEAMHTNLEQPELAGCVEETGDCHDPQVGETPKNVRTTEPLPSSVMQAKSFSS